MATIDEILKIGDSFVSAVQSLQTSRAIADATDAIEQINTAGMATAEKNKNLKNVGNQLALRLAGLGAPATTIQAAFSAIAPDQPKSLEEMRTQAALTGDQQMKDLVAAEDKNLLNRQKAVKQVEVDAQKQLIKQTYDYKKEILDLQSKAKTDENALQKIKEINGAMFGKDVDLLNKDRIPSEKDKEKAQSQLNTHNKIMVPLNKITKTIKEVGPELIGTKSSLLRSWAAQLDLALKEKGYGELGALAGPDQALLEAIRGGNPDSITNWFKVNAKGKLESVLSDLESNIEDITEKNLNNYNYKWVGRKTQGERSPAGQTEPNMSAEIPGVSPFVKFIK